MQIFTRIRDELRRRGARGWVKEHYNWEGDRHCMVGWIRWAFGRDHDFTDSPPYSEAYGKCRGAMARLGLAAKAGGCGGITDINDHPNIGFDDIMAVVEELAAEEELAGAARPAASAGTPVAAFDAAKTDAAAVEEQELVLV